MRHNQFKSVPVQTSEITPESTYLSRRQFLKAMGVVGSGALLAACAGKSTPLATEVMEAAETTVATFEGSSASIYDPGEPLNTYDEITNFNNFYEFSLDKTKVAKLAKDFQTSPWDVEVFGLVENPKTFGMEDLLKFEHEERIYRMRCVEGWSMVIPWLGFPLSRLLAEVSPLSTAKYVRFQTLANIKQMPGLNNFTFPWPYEEGLRMDEAMHDLTILATGLYGKTLPPQNGAPIRLVVPWKYGFKGIKSIIKIELTEEQPENFWNETAPHEYGFYANVNPDVKHPRWSQSTERRIGETGRRETLMFNGYAEEVAHLYAGMDLSVNY